MNWLLLDPTSRTSEHFTLRQLRLGLQRLGHEVRLFRVLDGTAFRTPQCMEDAFKVFRPDRIVWCDATGLPYYELLSRPPWRSIPKIILWFDEPVISVERFGLGDVMKHTAGREDVIHGIWDGYWRKDALARWGIQARAIHLAADEVEYHTVLDSKQKLKIAGLDQLLEKQKKDPEVVFIGMLHSSNIIENRVQALPRGLQALARAIQARLDDELRSFARGGAAREIPNRDRLWLDGEADLTSKEKLVLKAECSRDPGNVWALRWAIWAMAKNAVRLRILRKTMEVAPLCVFCEQRQLAHASEDEWRSLLGGEPSRLRMIDTSSMKVEELPLLYHYGEIHIQATDPQSVEGGIPYRVFQTAASGKVLITDLKPELLECFSMGREMLGYDKPENLTSLLSNALADRERWKELGRAARERVEKEHTWCHRIATFESWIDSSSK